MMVHELRAPLTAIKDSAELMVEYWKKRVTSERDEEKKFLGIIDQQSKNLLWCKSVRSWMLPRSKPANLVVNKVDIRYRKDY